MPQNANGQRVIDVCNEFASLRARLNASADAAVDAADVKAEMLTDAAKSAGEAYDKLWAIAGFVSSTPNEKEDEWARLLSPSARKSPQVVKPEKS